MVELFVIDWVQRVQRACRASLSYIYLYIEVLLCLGISQFAVAHRRFALFLESLILDYITFF